MNVVDIMSKNVISVKPENSVIDGYKLIAENKFDGVPVVDDNNILVGILTEYDLIIKGMHLPTFQNIFAELSLYKKSNNLSEDVKRLKELKVRDVMNPDPLTISNDVTLEKVIKEFQEHHRVNPIPVVDKNNKVIGVVSRYDVLKVFNIIDNSAGN